MNYKEIFNEPGLQKKKNLYAGSNEVMPYPNMVCQGTLLLTPLFAL